MISLTFSLDQVRSAPPEVRRWIEHEGAAALAALSRPELDPLHPHAAARSACTAPEAGEVYELIKGNFLLSQVFFELACETPGNRGGPSLYALGLVDMLRHTRLADGDRLVDCFNAINQAFQTIRNEPEANVFGFDQYGRVWIHPMTQDSIRELWEQLFHRQPPMTGEPAMPTTGPALAGFTPSHLGPSGDVAEHTSAPVGINF